VRTCPVSRNGAGYDYLDELIVGVLRFEETGAAIVQPTTEMVFYQSTPARHIFDLIDRTALNEHDVLVDLGSGLGHVPLLASICTRARSIGVELEPVYVDCARQSAETLNLKNVTFIQQDARAAKLTDGTVFYMYTPFTGNMLRAVLDSLQREGTAATFESARLAPARLRSPMRTGWRSSEFRKQTGFPSLVLALAALATRLRRKLMKCYRLSLREHCSVRSVFARPAGGHPPSSLLPT